LRAGLGDIAEARSRALAPPPAAAEPAWNADLALLAADVAARAAPGQLCGGRGHACARHDGTAHAGRGGTDGNTRADRADGSTGHRARAELRRTGHQAVAMPGPKMPSASRQRGQHHDQRMVDGWLVGMNLELGEQARADADDDGQHQDLDA
jgi:hypothetical protein